MSHQQFILAYQKGSLGCCVRTVQAIWLFVSRKLEHGRATQFMVARWFVEFLLMGVTLVALYIYLSVIIGVLCSVLGFFLFGLFVTHRVAELVIRYALEDDVFFRLATTERALIVVVDEEENLPSINNVVPLPPARRRDGKSQ